MEPRTTKTPCKPIARAPRAHWHIIITQECDWLPPHLDHYWATYESDLLAAFNRRTFKHPVTLNEYCSDKPHTRRSLNWLNAQPHCHIPALPPIVQRGHTHFSHARSPTLHHRQQNQSTQTPCSPPSYNEPPSGTSTSPTAISTWQPTLPYHRSFAPSTGLPGKVHDGAG